MPKKIARARARRDARAGKKPSTQAGEYIREEMHALKKGSGNVRSRKQAIAIGLSEARREGVKLDAPKKGRTSAATRRKARRPSHRFRNGDAAAHAQSAAPPGLHDLGLGEGVLLG